MATDFSCVHVQPGIGDFGSIIVHNVPLLHSSANFFSWLFQRQNAMA
jgi:hypothetical protein